MIFKSIDHENFPIELLGLDYMEESQPAPRASPHPWDTGLAIVNCESVYVWHPYYELIHSHS